MNIFLQILFLLSICVSICSLKKKHPWHEKLKVTGSICITDECYDHAAFLSRIIDPSTDPCNDFYKYVCANWNTKHPGPAYYPEWSIDTEMGESSFNNTRIILKEPITPNDSFYMRMAKTFFKQCSELPYLGLYDNVTIASYVRGSGYFPLFNPLNSTFNKKKPWMAVHNYYLSLTGESALFDITLHNDKSRNYEPTFHISTLTSPYGLFMPNKLFSVTKLKIYGKFLKTILRDVIRPMEYWKSNWVVEKDLMEVLAFRHELHSIIGEDFIADKQHKNLTIRELDRWYREMATSYKPTARISWFEVLKTLHKKPYDSDNIKEIVVDVTNEMYLQLLARLLSKTPESVIVNHIHLYFIERHLNLGLHLKVKMMDIITQNRKLIGAVRYIGKRWQICIATNQVTEAVGLRYVKRFFSPETKEKAENLAKELKSMMEVIISDSTWLNSDTKDRSKQLITDMTANIGYPQFYDDGSKKNDFINDEIIEPGNIDAIYSPYSNSLSITAGYLNSPMFSARLPPAVIYGSTGTIIGHQMYRAFGSEEITKFESKYSWTRNMLDVYTKKTKCFVEMYDGIPITELEYIRPIPTINGINTLDENMADVMGLKLAYEVFRKDLWSAKRCKYLPNLPDITCSKLFFISFAMSYCSALTPDAMMELVEFGVQSTPRVRVNTAVANMKEFGEIFNCPNKARLNPQKRCNLWT